MPHNPELYHLLEYQMREKKRKKRLIIEGVIGVFGLIGMCLLIIFYQ
tara:strand:+ start:211 stop:351 length:141 start_codon:yes stop_codon:yes gene_type:complete